MITAILLVLLTILIFKLVSALRNSDSNIVGKKPCLPPSPERSLPLLGHLLQLGERPHIKLAEWGKGREGVFTVDLGTQK
jgi:hypothetical protein